MIRSKLIVLFVVAFIMACGNQHAPANITYERFHELPRQFAIDFLSDTNFEASFAKNKHQKIIYKTLTCSLSDDANFDIKHRLRFAFEGDIQLQNAFDSGGKVAYRYTSKGNFYENISNSHHDLIWGESLTQILQARKSIQCKVVMTVYLSSPYYSNKMSIPTADITLRTEERQEIP